MIAQFCHAAINMSIMRILHIHPEDDPEKGPWASLRWDRIVDLGLGGAKSYERWTRRFHCSVVPLDSFRSSFDVVNQVRDLLRIGCNRLVDQHGLDWWEILSILLTGEVETLILLQRFVRTLRTAHEIYVSRPGLHASILKFLVPSQVRVFPSASGIREGRAAHYVRVLRRLSPQQIFDVFWDKYDSGYQFRGRLVRRPSASKKPVVLVPTAYVNVSRTGMAYARTFPDENFLLVSTRRSGWVKDPPPNVTTVWLSSYAAVQDRSEEFKEIERRWRLILKELEEIPEFHILSRLGYWDEFPQRLRHGIEVRDAWLNVLDNEPVHGVLCADDSNPYTRIPLLLAKARGLPNIACHHGALDSRYIFKRAYGDVIWVKGKMEKDYLVRRCKVPEERVEIAAPLLPSNWQQSEYSKPETFRPYILFISEAADVASGRPEEFYWDILPSLADLAIATGRQLIVKLHPAESRRERARFVARMLSPEQNAVTRIVSGPLHEDLLEKTWFGITILSTVAIECAIRGIPCFLCKWLEFWPYGYVEQFLRYGAGIGLNDPEKIRNIPEYLRQYRAEKEVKENCWQPVKPGRLRELLSSSREDVITAAS